MYFLLYRTLYSHVLYFPSSLGFFYLFVSCEKSERLLYEDGMEECVDVVVKVMKSQLCLFVN